MNIEKPFSGWRKGQTIFNFLEWLHENKSVSLNQSQRMADPFYLSDADWDKCYEEFLKAVSNEGSN